MGFKPDAKYRTILETTTEHNSDLARISLSFLSFNAGVSGNVIPFESFKDLYYEISGQNKELKEFMTENVLDIAPFYVDGMIGYLEYIQILKS
ncbi:MAG: hypothetical protein GTO02_20105 [Candidatus Dadabacteria bacterium]|nr:hypothetical protein [Candidatus Dadabacteria bacterium]